ncbi:DUF821 domain-containing protein [Amylocarpus encephaloides]|uniref:DUF821 domain-containing protein n=1 Tax=Amylocarpus encephaloides TaxID=45428 RepID=A0A9P7YLS2_9HELO|nr:DUF821 domain-containing protein [Amylocarpus encephaloides]
MSQSQSRFHRRTLVSIGSLSFFAFLYTCILLYPLYRQHIPKALLPPATSYPAGREGLELCSGMDHSPAWSFNKTRDERAYGLNTEQCHAAFPGLFADIGRAMEYRKSSSNYMIEEDIDISWKQDGAVRAAILDQQLYIRDTRLSGSNHETPRILAILHALHRAIITSPVPLPDIEFSFTTSDIADPEHLQKTIWALSRTVDEKEKWLMSDFGFWSWPLSLVGGYEQIRLQISETELGFNSKKRQAIWRGALRTNKHREDLLRVTEGKYWADVKAVEWSTATEPKISNGASPVSMPEHCQYQFLIHTEGRSYSGRGKYLQNCNSVVIMPKRNWIEPHHSLLVSAGPDQNFVEVEEDFSDLEPRILELLGDPEKSQRIAQNGVDTFRDRYLTPAAQACYWRQLILGWAEVSFVPKALMTSSGQYSRGEPFETFVIQKAMAISSCSWMSRLFSYC